MRSWLRLARRLPVFKSGDAAVLMFEGVSEARRAANVRDKTPGRKIGYGQVVTVRSVEHCLLHDVCVVEADGVIAEVLDIYLAPVVEAVKA